MYIIVYYTKKGNCTESYTEAQREKYNNDIYKCIKKQTNQKMQTEKKDIKRDKRNKEKQRYREM